MTFDDIEAFLTNKMFMDDLQQYLNSVVSDLKLQEDRLRGGTIHEFGEFMQQTISQACDYAALIEGCDSFNELFD